LEVNHCGKKVLSVQPIAVSQRESHSRIFFGVDPSLQGDSLIRLSSSV